MILCCDEAVRRRAVYDLFIFISLVKCVRECAGACAIDLPLARDVEVNHFSCSILHLELKVC